MQPSWMGMSRWIGLGDVDAGLGEVEVEEEKVGAGAGEGGSTTLRSIEPLYW